MIALYIVIAYLLGSIPFGLLAGKMKGLDIRQHGSGNIGTTNVFRVCGKSLGIVVFMLDVLKGIVPVLIAKQAVQDPNVGEGLQPILAGVFAILGHNFPVWLKFKGGKGIATSAGVLGGLLPWTLLVAVITWIGFFIATRYVSVASILAAVSLPITTAVLTYRSDGLPTAYLVFTLIIALLAIWRHRSNIQRLRAGKENRFVRKS